jgi:hypothetical protein
LTLGATTPEVAGSDLAAETGAEGGQVAAKVGDAAFQGGRFGELETGAGVERHHMIADSVSSFSREDGPSIQMEVADHRMTASWGKSAVARAYRAAQGSMVAAADTAGAMQRDILNVRALFGAKDDDAILPMVGRVWGVG